MIGAVNTRGWLYAMARLTGDVSAVRRGRVGRRVKNKILGRVLGRAGFWRFIWR